MAVQDVFVQTRAVPIMPPTPLEFDPREGQHVELNLQLSDGTERLWVKVKGFADNRIAGEIANKLISTDEHGLRQGQGIVFDKTHVFSTLD